MQKANSVGSIVGMRRRGRFCASCQIWRGISGRKFPETSWNEKRMLKATHRPPHACRPPNENCSRKYFAGGPLEREWERGLRPVRGSAPTPAGAAPLRPAPKSKPLPRGQNIWRNVLENLRRLRCGCPYRNLKSERRPDGGASLLLQAHRSIIKCCLSEPQSCLMQNEPEEKV